MSLSPAFATSPDGTSIAWYDFGGTGPDLLLAHASGFCATMWGEVVDQLRLQFRVVAYDSRGHGRSESPGRGQDGWDWENFASDAKAVIDAARLDEPYGVGHSSGGASLVLLEERAPATFRSLYCFEPVVFPDDPPRGPWPERELAVRTRKRRASFPNADEAYTAFSSRGPFVTITDAARRRYVEDGFAPRADGGVELRLAPDDEAEVYAMATAHSGYQRLGFIECATAFAHGEHSTSFTVDEVHHLADRVPKGQFVEFDGLGHFGPLEAPDRFAQAVISAFIG